MKRKFTFTQRILTFCFLSAFLLNGCVAKKEFDALNSEKLGLENDKIKLQEELEVAKEQINRLEVQVEDLKGINAAQKSDVSLLTQELDGTKSELSRIKQLYDNLLSSSGQMNSDLAKQQQRLLAIEDELEIERKRNQELAEDLAKREQRVLELEKILEEKDAAVQELKRKVTDALLNFSDSDLSVEVKNGKVYVSLSEKLLFKTGSINVDSKGKTALSQLASALAGNKDLNVMVEGHTDNVPFGSKKQYMSDNWDLSVLRATSIVRILTENGIDPSIISAAGKGEFQPVASNDSAENKSLNRRTEIILTPKLDELFQILENY